MLLCVPSRIVRPTRPPEVPYAPVAPSLFVAIPVDVCSVGLGPHQTLSMSVAQSAVQAIVIGAGPAGLMAAEQLVQAGMSVAVYDAMPSVGRKLLRAGIGGLNLTHAENKADFISRYGQQTEKVEAWLQEFDADALRSWAADLGIETFVGSSGRVFPSAKKAAPLLRAWLH
ncbi:MAG: putative flavoprotein YhiN, partial [Reinekea sp.]